MSNTSPYQNVTKTHSIDVVKILIRFFNQIREIFRLLFHANPYPSCLFSLPFKLMDETKFQVNFYLFSEGIAVAAESVRYAFKFLTWFVIHDCLIEV